MLKLGQKGLFILVLLMLNLVALPFGVHAEDEVDCVDCQSMGRAPAVIIEDKASNAIEMASFTQKIEKRVEELGQRTPAESEESLFHVIEKKP